MNQKRFYIDHGIIHDRVTGQHWTTEPDADVWNGNTISCTCGLLNELWEESERQAMAFRRMVELGERLGDCG